MAERFGSDRREIFIAFAQSISERTSFPPIIRGLYLKSIYTLFIMARRLSEILGQCRGEKKNDNNKKIQA
jgi:hypothetical protein